MLIESFHVPLAGSEYLKDHAVVVWCGLSAKKTNGAVRSAVNFAVLVIRQANCSGHWLVLAKDLCRGAPVRCRQLSDKPTVVVSN